ncbi:MAG: bifunctional diguanylate cyclase/phosphodiesterase [Lachnospiraceae bacterium]|nr:bifunctional diguanylate cyclase/phosphodiesterase [Lachnospiraceae bacterium]
MADTKNLEKYLQHSITVEILTDCNKTFVTASKAFYDIFKYTEEECRNSNTIHFRIFSEWTFPSLEGLMQDAMSQGVSETIIIPLNTKSGDSIDTYLRCRMVEDGEYLIWSAQEVRISNLTEQEMVENITDLRLSQFKINFALECANAVRWEYQRETDFIWFGEEFYKMTGLSGTNWDYKFSTFAETVLAPYVDEIKEQIAELEAGTREMLSIILNFDGANGESFWYNIRGKFFDRDQGIVYGVSININEQKKMEKRLWDMAYRDDMTGLYRMGYVKDIFAKRIDGIRLRYPAFMVLDIAGFSNVNEAFGHDRGNRVLYQASRRLTELCKSEIIARVNGDEFLIVFDNVDDQERLQKVAEDIITSFRKPVVEGGNDFFLAFKIGITVPGEEKIDIHRLGIHLQDAEIALQRAKQDGRSSICIINNDIRKDTDELLTLSYELHKAVENKEFTVYFQPIILNKTKKPIGCEALVRWVHPEKGIISPMRFIPIAEEIGLIIAIGDFVMEESLKHLRKWISFDPNFYVSVNVSYIQFVSLGFVERVKELVTMYKVPYSALVIELTESIFISDIVQMTECLSELRDLGIRVSLDDFGTGYSSLSYLKRIPLDNLKIDREFLLDVSGNNSSASILRTIISLARDLNLSITAEGVETTEQISLLEEYGCDLLQGYYFSRPVLSEQIDEFLSEIEVAHD